MVLVAIIMNGRTTLEAGYPKDADIVMAGRVEGGAISVDHMIEPTLHVRGLSHRIRVALAVLFTGKARM